MAAPCPYIKFLIANPNPATVIDGWAVQSAFIGDDDAGVEEDEDEREALCNCRFSLANGARILLNTATRHL